MATKIDIVKRATLLDYFKENFNSNDEKKKLFKFIEKFVNRKETDDSKAIIEYLKWINNMKDLKTVKTDVPSGIMPSRYNCVLHDIKVQSKGPDDIVYDNNSAIRTKIARGNCILETTKDGNKCHDLIIYALRKFTGGLGDEDDMDRSENDWQKYFLKNISQTKYVSVLQKANGEAAHMSCRWIDNEFLICAGSKNVHLIFKNTNDIYKYEGERFLYARKIAQAIVDHLEILNEEKRLRFLSFMCWTKFTAIFEILVPESMHVEDLSYLKKPLLKFITFTENEIVEKPQSLCCMPPELSLEIGKLFELSCVEYSTITLNQIDDYLVKVRNDYGYEGSVLYFLDSDLNVIGILKKKTTWYIIIRAVREKLRSYLSNKSTTNLPQLKDKIKNRLVSIKNWIGFNDEDLNKWKHVCFEFVQWFDQKYHSNQISREDHASKFPVLWNQFLKESNLDDKIVMSLKKQSVFTSEIKSEIDDIKVGIKEDDENYEEPLGNTPPLKFSSLKDEVDELEKDLEKL